MLAKQDFKFTSDGFFILVNGMTIGELTGDGRMAQSNISYRQSDEFETTAEAIEWIKDQFISFLNSVSPKSPYQTMWEELKDIYKQLHQETPFPANKTVYGLMINNMDGVESNHLPSTDKTDAK